MQRGRAPARAGGLIVLIALVLLGGLALQAGPSAAAAPDPPDTALVVAAIGSDRLVVQDQNGATFQVQYIGIRGPVRSSVWSKQAVALHEPLTLWRWVRLEPDGPNEDEGYLLRHVYLADEPLPLAARMLAYGLATVAPYPLEHRYRARYLSVQRQAMADEVGLWSSRGFGPVRAWRPADSVELGYLAARPTLHRVLDLLYTAPSGRRILDRLTLTSPTLLTEALPDGAGGYSTPLPYLASINSDLLRADPAAVAAVIAHEGVHLVDFVGADLGLVDLDCYTQEVHAFGFMAQVWAELVGSGGLPEPKHPWESTLNEALLRAQQGDIETTIRRSAGYQLQCARDSASLAPWQRP